ncbi:hypothetical protein BJX64DRAFT_287136 [Aspergillus heterothallicus]
MATTMLETLTAVCADSPDSSKIAPVAVAEMNDPAPETTLTPIRYTYNCINKDSRFSFQESHDIPLELRVSQEPPAPPPVPAEEPTCVIELVTDVLVIASKNDTNPSDYTRNASLQDMHVKAKYESLMIIHSQLLLQTIRDVVKYYPSQNLVGDTVTLRHPYAVLVHHTSDLQKLHDQLAGEAETDSRVAAEKCRHIQILLDLLTDKIERTIAPAQKRLDKAAPTVISVDNAGSRNINGYMAYILAIKDFDGEKLVTNLPVMPRDYYDRTDNGQRRAAFIQRGSKARDILWDQYMYAKYDGKLMDKAKKDYRGPIVAGVCDIPGVKLPATNWVFDWDTAALKKPKTGPIVTTSRVVLPIDMDPEKLSRTAVTDDHLFIMCPVVLGFALSTKSWEIINVDSILELDDPDKIPPANIDSEKMKSADFIKNKGEGVVILLHGPPGVGKTYTVETIANNTRRPLISLTIADLGTEEDAIESRLTQWFALAQKWRAILLLDEADIFLECRDIPACSFGIRASLYFSNELQSRSF